MMTVPYQFIHTVIIFLIIVKYHQIEVQAYLHSTIYRNSVHTHRIKNINYLHGYDFTATRTSRHAVQRIITTVVTKKTQNSLYQLWCLHVKPLVRFLDITTSIATLSAGSLLSPSMAGGFLSGGLHAVTGPDHLAAILPSSIGLNGWYGMKIGAIWGFGHGLSAILLGTTAFLLRGSFTHHFKYIEKLSAMAENAVGFSLIAIGVLGLKENIFDTDEDIPNELTEKPRNTRAIFLNGILHGFSWDGAPSLAPAIAMTTWSSIMSFLISYCIGTMFMMSLAAGVLSEGSKRIGSASGNPDFSRNLSVGSSVVAIVLGLFWILKSTFM